MGGLKAIDLSSNKTRTLTMQIVKSIKHNYKTGYRRDSPSNENLQWSVASSPDWDSQSEGGFQPLNPTYRRISRGPGASVRGPEARDVCCLHEARGRPCNEPYFREYVIPRKPTQLLNIETCSSDSIYQWLQDNLVLAKRQITVTRHSADIA